MASKLIGVAEIESGMELTEPVKNKNGQILLNSGLILEEKHKLILKTWGIKNVSVKSEGVETESPAYEDLSQSLNNLKNIINWQPRNYQENELIQLALIFNKQEEVSGS